MVCQPEKMIWRQGLWRGLGMPRHTKHNPAPYHPVHLKYILQKKEEGILINLDILFCATPILL